MVKKAYKYRFYPDAHQQGHTPTHTNRVRPYI
ncbi:MAG: helix-turn-helix domain-containing protein [Methyloprofundus sp.]|nr:helix-turn-helix domain-containing protein [Methyloprofundus sp.]MBW6452997.1 helix-turn-helix domain-containing protein [Methyloprofundus sp.]